MTHLLYLMATSQHSSDTASATCHQLWSGDMVKIHPQFVNRSRKSDDSTHLSPCSYHPLLDQDISAPTYVYTRPPRIAHWNRILDACSASSGQADSVASGPFLWMETAFLALGPCRASSPALDSGAARKFSHTIQGAAHIPWPKTPGYYARHSHRHPLHPPLDAPRVWDRRRTGNWAAGAGTAAGQALS